MGAGLKLMIIALSLHLVKYDSRMLPEEPGLRGPRKTTNYTNYTKKTIKPRISRIAQISCRGARLAARLAWRCAISVIPGLIGNPSLFLNYGHTRINTDRNYSQKLIFATESTESTEVVILKSEATKNLLLQPQINADSRRQYRLPASCRCEFIRNLPLFQRGIAFFV